MAQLSSPGVSVTVIDESFYTPAAPGTVPLIIVASEESKQNSASTGTATGTLKANAGKVYLLTSQKDLSDTFGTSKFITDASNNPVHAGEQNEYGLQAAYSFLGVSNRAYVVRADIDLAQLNAKTVIPAGTPADGTFWFDTASSKFGVFEWNAASAAVTSGQSFMVKYPLVITDTTKVTNFSAGDYTPRASIGAVGSYAIVAVSTLVKLWFKKPTTHTASGWVEVGSDEWQVSWPTVQGTVSNPVLDSANDTLIINGVTCSGNSLVSLVSDINSKLTSTGISAANTNDKLSLFSTGVAINITGGTAITPTNKIGVSTAVYNAPALTIAPHTQIPQYKISNEKRPTGSLWIKTTMPNLGAEWIIKRFNENTGAWTEIAAPIYANNNAALIGMDSTGGGINLAINSLYVKANDSEDVSPLANFKIYRRKSVGATTITSGSLTAGTFIAQAYAFTISETIIGSVAWTTPKTVGFTIAATPTASGNSEAFLTALQTALIGSNIVATINYLTNQISISHINGGDIKLVDVINDPLAAVFNVATVTNLYNDSNGIEKHYVASLWTATSDSKTGGGFAIASSDAPTNEAADNQLWYNSIIDEVDIMIHNGSDWVGYLDSTAKTINHAGIIDELDTDPDGPIISATKPLLQSGGNPLANGDIWISTADLENFPLIYKYDTLLKKWVAVDTSDQTTENGIVFHDARWNTTGTTATASSISDLLNSNFLDFDAPDPALYPKGMLLWNLRRSGYNVKRFSRDYINVLNRNPRYNSNELMTDYYPHRWVSDAANQEDGSGTFGRKAQRAVVIQALQALVNSNQSIRDEESRIFNLIACPGYPELIGELVGLNVDRGLTAFVVGDTPARLNPDSTTLSNWGNNAQNAVQDNDTGLVSYDEYLGVFYPWGYTSDNIGNNIVVPPSHMILRTIALSDNVSYPWFAPAGTRRGGITNASAVGHIDMEGEFQSVALTNGHRDTLASIKVNPITYITGSGLVNYGQLTRARNASALDRINVARLVIYLRRQLAQLAKPYIFEPNDKITRDEIKQAAESLLLELVGQRALYDYVVVCDTSNNTPARIDRNELYLDIAIEPVKAVEFIYIPLRLKNTGEIKGLG